LVSFPPLIDMLKFSGYPYLIRGQVKKDVGCLRAAAAAGPQGANNVLRAGPDAPAPMLFRRVAAATKTPNTRARPTSRRPEGLQ
jgi:hypothetical protein